MEYYYNVLETIAENSDSILLTFFIVAAVASITFLIFGLPKLLPYLQARREAKYTHELARQQVIADVIKENSTVIAGTKTLLEVMVETQNSGFVRVHERLDAQGNVITAIDTKVSAVLDGQREIAGKANRILIHAEKK